MKLRVFSWIICFFLSAGCFSNFAYSEDIFKATESSKCDLCYQKEKRRCEIKCDEHDFSTRRLFQNCVEGCAERKCRRICQASRVKTIGGDQQAKGVMSDDYQEGELECDACLKKAEFEACNLPCSKELEPSECRQKCAKQRCINQCQLPDRPTRPLSVGIPAAHKCRLCKQMQEMNCKGKCGVEGTPGFIACKVSCVEENCWNDCNSD